MFVKLNRNTTYKNKKVKVGDIIEVSDDLGNRMILAGQAQKSNKTEFDKQNSNTTNDLEKLTIKELEELAKQKGLELKPKLKKSEIIEIIKGN